MSKRKILVVAMSAAMILSAALGVGVADASNEVTLADNDYAICEAFDVRLSYNAAGELNAEYNGLRAKAKISADDYEELGKLNDETTVIKYGILFAPTAYVTENPLTAENVFGKNRVYATSAMQAEEDEENGKETKRIECSEEAELKKGADGYYYAYCLLSDLDDEALLSGYTAKAYAVKYTIDENKMLSGGEYVFKTEATIKNAVYAVQKAIDAGNVDDYEEDLASAYVSGRTQKIAVEYTASYDGADPQTVSKEYDFTIGATVSEEDVLAKLTDIYPDDYDIKTEFVSRKIYAGEAEKISFGLTPKKASSSKPAAGLYVSGENSVEIKEETLTCDGQKDVAYTLFGDGTVVIGDEGAKKVLGKVNFKEKKFVMAEDGATLSQVLELGKEAYAKVSGYYLAGNNAVVKLNADGTGVYDLLGEATAVKYLLAYDESNGRYIAASNFSEAAATVTFGDTVEIDGFTAVALGSEENYNDIADYYICTTAGDYLNKIFRLNTDGTIVLDGEKVGAFMYFADGSVTAKIGESVYTANFTSETVNGATVKTIAISGNGAELTFKNESLANYSELTDKVNNLFGKTELVFEGRTAGPENLGYPRVKLTTTSTEYGSLAAITLPDGTAKWKKAEYGGSGTWGYFYHKLVYFAEQTSPTGGLIHFRIADDNGHPQQDDAVVKYEIKDGEMSLDMTNYNPNDSSQKSQYQVLYANIGTDTDLSNTYTDIYDVFASRYGTYYFYTDYRAENATAASNGGFILYNYHTAISGLESEWYKCEFWADAIGFIKYGSNETAYKIEFDSVKNVGTLTVYRAGEKKQYPIGIVNGNKFIDMRKVSFVGYDGFDNVKVAVAENAERDINAIEYAITTVNKTFENAGKVTETAVDAKTIYEKIAGTYYSGNYYHENGTEAKDKWWWGIGITLNADGTMVMTHESDKTGTYEIKELGDAFGIITIDCPYPIVTSGEVVHDAYYALIDDQYVLRITNGAMNCAKWAFWDFVPADCEFSTWNVFDEMVGEGTSYTDGSATLTLDEVLASGKNNYKGASFTLTDGDNTVSGNYDLVPTAEDAGKLFIDVISGDDHRYVIGDYRRFGDKYVLSFTVTIGGEEKSYFMAGSADDLAAVKTYVAGTYFGAENIEFTSAAEVTFSSVTSGTISENGITANFVVESGRIVITYTKGDLDYVAIK